VWEREDTLLDLRAKQTKRQCDIFFPNGRENRDKVPLLLLHQIPSEGGIDRVKIIIKTISIN